MITASLRILREKTKNEKLSGYLSLAEKSVSAAVAEVGQTFVDGIKGTDEWNNEVAKEAALMALDKAKEIMGEKALTAFNMLIGDAETFLAAQIEREVRTSK